MLGVNMPTAWVNPEPEATGFIWDVAGEPDQANGHFFVGVGYNDVGFLVQNSWGSQWGRGGFATLPYDDWLASAYDAWVARPGVPSIVSPFEEIDFT